MVKYRRSRTTTAPLPAGIEVTNAPRDGEFAITRVYLARFEPDYPAMNAIYQSCFASGKLPARTCIGVAALACGALVEIDLLARNASV